MPSFPSFQGTYTALVTPFRDGKVDEPAFQRLIEQQIAGGVDGIVAVGTTGESPTLDHAEHLHVVELAVRFAGRRCPVIAGTGSNSTREAVEMTREAQKLGANGILLVAPYYNKPSQTGLIKHFASIADETKLPVILYSIPGRCGIEIAVPTVAALAQSCPNIIAIKEAGGTVERVSALRQALPASFEILSGDDSLTLPFISVGAVGVISVASNLLPAEVAQLVKAALQGDRAGAESRHRRLYPLFRSLFIEPNPVPIKAALSYQGWITEDVRLPLVPMEPGTRAALDAALAPFGLPTSPR